MINPGVITLAKKRIANQNCCVEDNIGEAIHLHVGPFRYDMSTEEYRAFTKTIVDAAKELFPNQDILNELFAHLDPVFLNMISGYLYDIDHISYEKCKLSKIRCQTDSRCGGLVWTKIPKSRIVEALRGKDGFYKRYTQENHPFQSNMDRLNGVLNFMKDNPEAALSKGVVLFNNQNCVRDGQHRASCAYYLFGDIEVPVMRIYFKHPERVNIRFPSLRERCKQFVKRLLRFGKHQFNRFKRLFSK